MMIRDVLMVLLAMALFVFALQPRDHVHGRQRYETEALEDAAGRPAFDASR